MYIYISLVILFTGGYIYSCSLIKYYIILRGIMSNNRSSQVLKELPEEEKHLIFTKVLINIKHPRVFEGMLNTIVDYKDYFYTSNLQNLYYAVF